MPHEKFLSRAAKTEIPFLGLSFSRKRLSRKLCRTETALLFRGLRLAELE